MINDENRPIIDNSKEYEKHFIHVSDCKWCKWDRKFIIKNYNKLIKEFEMKKPFKRII